jgi:outer membrane protein assembly factor BamB
VTAPRADAERLVVQYPGGIAARYRWTGSGGGQEMFAISEAVGSLIDHGPLVGQEPDRMCRLELRVESPSGGWTARFASPIFDTPKGALWDEAHLLLVAYGFVLYALEPRTGKLAWSHTSGSPIVAILASSRLDHVLLQAEIETFALRRTGDVAWRAAHSDVVIDAALIAGRLDLTTYGGAHLYLDAASGQAS